MLGPARWGGVDVFTRKVSPKSTLKAKHSGPTYSRCGRGGPKRPAPSCWLEGFTCCPRAARFVLQGRRYELSRRVGVEDIVDMSGLTCRFAFTRAKLSFVDTVAKDVARNVQHDAVHTPSTLLNAFTSRFSAPEDSRVLCLRGVYRRKGNKLYGSGYAYDELQEETSDSRLTLQVPGPLRGILRNGLPYVLKGSLAKVPRSNRGTVELHFVVADVLEELEPRFTEEDMRLAKLLSQKGEVGFKNIDAVLRHKLYDDEKPVLTLLYGVSAIVDADVREALAEAEGRYELLEDAGQPHRPTQGLHKRSETLRATRWRSSAVVAQAWKRSSHPDLLEDGVGARNCPSLPR